MRSMTVPLLGKALATLKDLPRPARSGLLFVLFLALLFSRRFQQLWVPQVWDEDGTKIIPGFLEHGVMAFLFPVKDMLITVPKLISWASLWISVWNYPLVSTLLTFVFTALVALAVAQSPTRLKGKVWCALAVFAVPSDPEVFGVPLYTFWWAALLLFLLCVWDERHPALWLRAGYLLVGGLSSPAVVLILPVLFFRAWRFRAVAAERLLAPLGALVCAAQVLHTTGGSGVGALSVSSLLTHPVPVFFGRFLVGNLVHPWQASAVAGVLLGLFVLLPPRAELRNPTHWTLLYLLAGSIALVWSRVDLLSIHPVVAGPRYFFFPFVFLWWLLVQRLLFETSGRRTVVTAAAFASLALANALPCWSRTHDDLDWKGQLERCLEEPRGTLSIQWDGHRESAWSLTLSREEWKRLVRKEIF